MKRRGGGGESHSSENSNTSTESSRSGREIASNSSTSDDTQDGSGASNNGGKDADMEWRKLYEKTYDKESITIFEPVRSGIHSTHQIPIENLQEGIYESIHKVQDCA